MAEMEMGSRYEEASLQIYPKTIPGHPGFPDCAPGPPLHFSSGFRELWEWGCACGLTAFFRLSQRQEKAAYACGAAP